MQIAKTRESKGVIIVSKKPADLIGKNEGEYNVLLLLQNNSTFNRTPSHHAVIDIAPKGEELQGEMAKGTATRELREETGITEVELIDGFEHTTDPYFINVREKDGTESSIKKVTTYYLAEVPSSYIGAGMLDYDEQEPSSSVKLSTEHLAYAWVPIPEAIRLIYGENIYGTAQVPEKTSEGRKIKAAILEEVREFLGARDTQANAQEQPLEKQIAAWMYTNEIDAPFGVKPCKAFLLEDAAADNTPNRPRL